MHKRLLAMTIILLFSSTAFADNEAPSALIRNVSSTPVSQDLISVACYDPNSGEWGTPANWLCNAEKWYYFSEEPCSDQKEPYMANSVFPLPGMFWATVTASCPEHQDAKYLCLWVEDRQGLSDWKQSQELKLDCSVEQAEITSPTTASPATRPDNDSVEVQFTIGDPDTREYRVKITGGGNEICDSGWISIWGAGNYTGTCSWGEVADISYDVTVTVKDKVGNEASSTMTNALQIEAEQQPPECLSDFSVYMMGTSTTGIPDAVNLNNLCHDPNGENLDFTVNAPGCTAIVESVNLNPATGKISIGAPLNNEDGSCTVNITASDGTSVINESFDIVVFKTGDIDIKIFYNGTEYDPDSGHELYIQAAPGDEVCFDLEIENNLMAWASGRPLDLALVLDASGTMEQEMDSVKDTISELTDAILERCPIENCFRLGAVVMEGCGAKEPGGEIFYCPEMDLTTNTESIKWMIDNMVMGPGEEPWADYAINLVNDTAQEPIPPTDLLYDGDVVRWNCRIDDFVSEGDITPMSWRAGDITRMVIIISDASNDWQTRQSAGIRDTVYDYDEIAGWVASSPFPDVVVTGIGNDGAAHAYPCDGAGCPICSPAGCIYPLEDELRNVAVSTGAPEAAVFNNPAEIKEKIMDMVLSEVDFDVVTLTMEDPEWPFTPDPPPEEITVERESTYTQQFCFSIPDEEEENGYIVFTLEDSEGTFLDGAGIVVELETCEHSIQAVIVSPDEADEGEEIEFYGGLSSTTEGSIDSYEWDFGDGTTGTGETAMHTYVDEGSGEYTVTLTVSDAVNTDSASKEINVFNVAPSGSIISENVVSLGTPLFLEADFQDPGTEDTLTYRWDCDGDGVHDRTGMFTDYAWSTVGTYEIQVTVTDNDHLSGTATKTIRVTPEPSDILSVEDLKTLKAGTETSSFEPGDNVELQFDVLNHYLDLWELPRQVKGDITMSLLDAVTLQKIDRFSKMDETFNPGDNFYTETISLPPGEEKNYIVEVKAELTWPNGLSERFTANNSKQKIIYASHRNEVFVPEMPLFLAPCIALVILAIMLRRQTR